MEDSYSILARHYDSLMADIDYASYAGFYEKIWYITNTDIV